MLQNIRDRSTGWLAYVIVIGISIPFALWGIDQYFTNNQIIAAEINDTKISLERLNNEYLSLGLVEKGHAVTIYSPSFHPYTKKSYKGVQIIKKFSPVNVLGNSAANFIYDYLCLTDAVKRDFEIILQLGLITSALSIIFCRHKGKLIATNIDGLEWKRSKW